jgi:hypothetical protein
VEEGFGEGKWIRFDVFWMNQCWVYRHKIEEQRFSSVPKSSVCATAPIRVRMSLKLLRPSKLVDSRSPMPLDALVNMRSANALFRNKLVNPSVTLFDPPKPVAAVTTAIADQLPFVYERRHSPTEGLVTLGSIIIRT